MGQEIADSRFSQQDFAAFEERLRTETALLEAWFQDGVFSDDSGVGGFELEAWLVDAQADPTGINQAYLARLDNPLVVPELVESVWQAHGVRNTLTMLVRRAHELGAAVIAPVVDSAGRARLLSGMGVDYGQGVGLAPESTEPAFDFSAIKL